MASVDISMTVLPTSVLSSAFSITWAVAHAVSVSGLVSLENHVGITVASPISPHPRALEPAEPRSARVTYARDVRCVVGGRGVHEHDCGVQRACCARCARVFALLRGELSRGVRVLWLLARLVRASLGPWFWRWSRGGRGTPLATIIDSVRRCGRRKRKFGLEPPFGPNLGVNSVEQH